MSNILPSSVNGYISIVIGLALALMTAFMLTIPSGQNPPLWAVLVNSGLAYMALAIKGGNVMGEGSSIISKGDGK